VLDRVCPADGDSQRLHPRRFELIERSYVPLRARKKEIPKEGVKKQ
jgi:hypothetical protein